MGEHYSARIHIGGRLLRRHITTLREAIIVQAPGLDWGDCNFAPATLDELLTAVDDDGHLSLYNDEASYGQFVTIEAACQQIGLAYDRFSDGHYDDGAIVEMFRPGLGMVIRSHDSGSILVDVTDVEEAILRGPAALFELLHPVPDLPVLEIKPRPTATDVTHAS